MPSVDRSPDEALLERLRDVERRLRNLERLGRHSRGITLENPDTSLGNELQIGVNVIGLGESELGLSLAEVAGSAFTVFGFFSFNPNLGSASITLRRPGGTNTAEIRIGADGADPDGLFALEAIAEDDARVRIGVLDSSGTVGWQVLNNTGTVVDSSTAT